MTAWPWPAPDDDAGAAHLVPGTRIPRLALPASDGTRIDVSQLPGATVLFVYPWTGRPGLPNPPDWDDIPGAHGSTPEAHGFRDCQAEFQQRGVRVLGLSGQDSLYQREFAERAGLPFPLLSDSGFAFADALRLPRFATGGVTYLKRLTLVVADGCIIRTIYPVHPPDTHARDVLATIGAALT